MEQQLSKIECERIEPFLMALERKIYIQDCTRQDMANFISIVKEILKPEKQNGSNKTARSGQG
jgi:hypothetical protein